MAYWLLKDYVRAANTLLLEANSAHVNQGDVSLSNIFNFYYYLRRHPLVVRQRLTDACVQVNHFFTARTVCFLCSKDRLETVRVMEVTLCISQVGSTEKFLAVARRLEVLITPAERRLFFRTASQHMALGCPMLALDVLSRLPKEIAMLGDDPQCLRDMLSDQVRHSLEAILTSPDLQEEGC